MFLGVKILQECVVAIDSGDCAAFITHPRNLSLPRSISLFVGFSLALFPYYVFPISFVLSSSSHLLYCLLFRSAVSFLDPKYSLLLISIHRLFSLFLSLKRLKLFPVASLCVCWYQNIICHREESRKDLCLITRNSIVRIESINFFRRHNYWKSYSNRVNIVWFGVLTRGPTIPTCYFYRSFLGIFSMLFYYKQRTVIFYDG